MNLGNRWCTARFREIPLPAGVGRGEKVTAWRRQPGCWREARGLTWHTMVAPVFYLSCYVCLGCSGLMETTEGSECSSRGES